MFKLITAIFAVAALQAASAHAVPNCDDPLRNREVCYKMNHLRAQIHALDGQRELMQMNPSFYTAIGKSLSTTADTILHLLGPGLPEHQQGLAGVKQLGDEIASNATKNDVSMAVNANLVRSKCATCHATANPAGGVKWDDIFKTDWTQISMRCSDFGRNPYLCKSMNGMLSSYGYLLTGYNADMKNYEMTEQAANEVVRILTDIKAKNFRHLPEPLRLQAESAAREVATLAAQRDPAVFERSLSVANACMQCHQATRGNGVAPRLNFAGLDQGPLKTWK